MNWQALGIGVVLAALSSSPSAQKTVGEVLDAGGKQLGKAEVVATLGGAKVSGDTSTGSALEIDFKPNGSLSGNIVGSGSRRRNGSVSGTWTVDETGKVCFDETVTFFEAKQSKGCVFYYAVSDQYYVTGSDSTDRSVAVMKRTIKK